MNLNKYRDKKMKIIYDGNKIIKKGKKELYSFVYKRIWDLSKYDTKVLENYGLKKATYVYIGSSDKYNLKARCSQFRNDINNNKTFVSKEIRVFIRKLKIFYELETSYTAKEIDYLLYYNAEIIARCESREGATKLEKYFTTKYHHLDFMSDILEKHTILLSKVDSNLKDMKDGAVKMLKTRNIA